MEKPSFSQKQKKISVLFFLFILAFFIFLVSIFYKITTKREVPNLKENKYFTALRGSVLTEDKLNIANSKKLYKVSVNAGLIYEHKKDLFAKLFAIYSGEDILKIRQKLSKNQYVTLSYNINAKQAHQIGLLSQKLYGLKVFKPIVKNNKRIYQTIEVKESGERRLYPYERILTPVIGYIQKYEDDEFTKVRGVKGIEKYYDEYLHPRNNGRMSGKKDVRGNIIFNKKSIMQKQENGFDIILNIPMKLQSAIEEILIKHKEHLQAQEIIAVIMESQTGKIKAFASSNRFNPSSIKRGDYDKLNIRAIEYTFEPGSVLKPIILAHFLEDNIVKPQDIIRGYNGKFKIGKKTITDLKVRDWFSIENIIVYSSNIGMTQLGLKLHGLAYHKYLRDIGFNDNSGIDVPYEKRGVLPTVQQLNTNIYKATVSYGYGISVNFMQLFKIYNAFNNQGKAVTPRLVNYIRADDGKALYTKVREKRLFSPKTANQINRILQKTVKFGTTKVIDTKGLQVGGKSGTAHIAKKGKYVDEYISSVFGFANDVNASYTIGVTTFLPQKNYKRTYFGSKSSGEVFKEILSVLMKQGYLTPEKE